jgi:2-oxoglutarate dehydrogenase E1 component
MASNKENTIFENTSFLQGSNSSFIKELYLQYLKNSESLPKSWAEFFEGLNEDQEIIKREILGPTWAPRKNNNLKKDIYKKYL